MQTELFHSRRTLNRRDGAAALFLGLVAVTVTADAWADILRLGSAREELSYLYLTPVVIAFIIWHRRDRLVDCPVDGGGAGLIVMGVGWGVSWYGYLADPVLWRGGAVLVLVGSVLAAIGLRAAWRLWPAFAASVFLVPISPDGRYRVAEPLQVMTATATQGVCDVLGIDVARSGNLLSINGVDVTVAEACNGMRMVFTLLLVCYAAAFTGPDRPWRGLLVVLLSPLVAVIANVVRLVPTVWVFGHATPGTARTFHDAAGWVMLAVAFLVLSGLLRLSDRLLRAAVPDMPSARSTRGGLAAAS